MTKPILDPWNERVNLSAYDGGGRVLAPERAYAGMPADARIAASICDAVISNRWGWANSVLLCVIGEKEPATSTRTQKFFEARGWRTVEDAYDAANVSQAQRVAFGLHLSLFSHREIAEIMETTTHAAQMQVLRAKEKLHNLLVKTTENDNG